jgi:hypothetical protein
MFKRLEGWWLIIFIFICIIIFVLVSLGKCNDISTERDLNRMMHSKCEKACKPDNFRVDYQTMGPDLVCLCYKKPKMIMIEKVAK